MKISKLCLTLATIMAVGCASPGYTPSAGDGQYGYHEQSLGNAQYRVTFNGNRILRDDTLVEHTLRRAAEIADDHGAQWFLVTRADELTQPASAQRISSTSSGASAATAGQGSRQNLAIQIRRANAEANRASRAIESDRPRTSYSIDIEIGKGPAPAGGLGFDVKELLGGDGAV